MWMRRSLPRRECASTTTKYSCFIVFSVPSSFGFGARALLRDPGGAMVTTDWRNRNCNNVDTPLSSRHEACKSLIKLVLFNFIVPRRLPGTLFLRNLVERRGLLFQLVRRDFEQRFVGSAIGWIWGLIHPLVLLVSWYFVFQ